MVPISIPSSNKPSYGKWWWWDRSTSYTDSKLIFDHYKSLFESQMCLYTQLSKSLCRTDRQTAMLDFRFLFGRTEPQKQRQSKKEINSIVTENRSRGHWGPLIATLKPTGYPSIGFYCPIFLICSLVFFFFFQRGFDR